MKKLLALFIISLISCTSVLAMNKSDDYKYCKDYTEKIKQERATISNALQLSEEQSKKMYELTQKTNTALNEKFYSLKQETVKLNLLRAENKNPEDIKSQEKVISQLKKEIDNIVQDENKAFKKILNHEQRSKLRLINKLQRKSEQAKKHQKDYYKSNPKMRKFAPHIQAN